MRKIPILALLLAIGDIPLLAEQQPPIPHEQKQKSEQSLVLANLTVEDSVTITENGRRITMNTVEKPLLPKKQILPKSIPPALSNEQIEDLLKDRRAAIYVSVSATIYDHSKTFIIFQNFKDGKKEKFSVWSNIDWNYLGGFSSFKVRDQEFVYFLAHGNASYEQIEHRKAQGKPLHIPEIPTYLPDIEKSGPRYVIIEGNEDNDLSMDFIEGVHEFYANNEAELKLAFLEREKQNQIRLEAQRKQRAAPPKDIIINYWPGEGAEKIQR